MTKLVATRAHDEGPHHLHVHTVSGRHIGTVDLESGLLTVVEVMLASEFAQLAFEWIDRFRSGELAAG